MRRLFATFQLFTLFSIGALGGEIAGTLRELKNAGYNILSDQYIPSKAEGYIPSNQEVFAKQELGCIKIKNNNQQGVWVAISTVPPKAQDEEAHLVGLVKIKNNPVGYVPENTAYTPISGFYEGKMHRIHILDPPKDAPNLLPEEN
ncbi:hypothetical protein O181_066707 [Austropuccinia psidii MF-1]|uniref:Uncharacterized protein n=1 Tax=Austropuccinia psidii MF-1 TaxID=1389203 RepID=A0A9Q3I4J5_9BASI|nr:hypothetical protein [Austropuccinia psidii MF-1]